MNVSAEVAVIGAAILDVVVPGAGPRVFETGSIPCPGLKLSTGGDAMNEAVALSLSLIHIWREYYRPTEQGVEGKFKARLQQIKDWKAKHAEK